MTAGEQVLDAYVSTHAFDQLLVKHTRVSPVACDCRFFPSFLTKIHEKRGNFCIFLLKIAVKEGKPDQVPSPF